MTAFDRAVAVMFDNQDLARAATYTPPGANPVAVSLNVIPSVQDTEAMSLRTRRNIMVVEARVADLPTPVEAATLAVGGVTYRVQSRPAYADDERLTWRLECFEVVAMPAAAAGVFADGVFEEGVFQ